MDSVSTMDSENMSAWYIQRISQRFLAAQCRHPIRHHRSLQPFSRQSASSMHRNAGMLSKLIPGVDRGMEKGSPSLAVFSAPPIGLHRR